MKLWLVVVNFRQRKIILESASFLMDLMKCSKWADIFGDRGGRRMAFTPDSFSNLPKRSVNFVSRSMIRYSLPSKKPPSQSVRLRATCCIHASFGFSVHPAKWARRDFNSITNKR